jgi:hypothetical protein
MIKISDHTSADLDNLAAAHFSFLNPIVLQPIAGYANNSLIGRIRKARTVSLGRKFRRQVAFWDYLLANNQAVLYDLITGRPARLKQLIGEIALQFPRSMFCKSQTYEDSTLTPFGQKIKTVFNYARKYRNTNECVLNFNQFNLSYCTYCNAAPVEVTSYPLNGPITEWQALHQLDHFYPQSRHPYLAQSFFNLIPGCSPCNAQLKLEKDFDIDTHFNPFHNRLDDEFEFIVNTLTPADETQLDFSAMPRAGSVYSDQSLIDFRLMNRYNLNHKRIIYKMINYMRFHGPAIVISQMRQMPGLYANPLQAHEAKLEAMGVPLTQAEISHYPLGKLKRDICLRMQML